MLSRLYYIILLQLLITIQSFQRNKRFQSIFQLFSRINDDFETNSHKSNDVESYIDNPSFFPRNLVQLAQDSSLSIKLGLFNQLNRIRIDINTRYTSKHKNILKWFVILTAMMLDDEINTICMFLNDENDVNKCRQIWSHLLDLSCDRSDVKNPLNMNSIGNLNDLLDSNMNSFNKSRVMIFSISENSFNECEKDLNDKSLFIICQPDNIYTSCNPHVLEHIQTLCLHSSLRSRPVSIVMINPQLMSTAWNDYGMTTPMLLNDFHQVYYIRDNYQLLNKKDSWCGLIYRYLVGLDLFILNGCTAHSSKLDSYIRVKTWLKEESIPVDLSAVITGLLLDYSNFIENRLQYLYEHRNVLVESKDDKVYKYDRFDDRNTDSMKYSWKNIVPAPKY